MSPILITIFGTIAALTAYVTKKFLGSDGPKPGKRKEVHMYQIFRFINFTTQGILDFVFAIGTNMVAGLLLVA